MAIIRVEKTRDYHETRCPMSLLRELGFSFDGVHCIDMGFYFAPTGVRIIQGSTVRNQYSIAGRSGTVLMSGHVREPFEYTGALYPIHEPRNQREAQVMLRKAAAWLTSGRHQLILDHEPDVYYMAQVDDELEWSTKKWFGGELTVTFICQPTAYFCNTTTQALNATETSCEITLDVPGNQPAPLRLRITPWGSAHITSVHVSTGSKHVQLVGLHLPPGESLTINMEEPISASITTGENALPYAKAFDVIDLPPGANLITVTLGYSSGTLGARVAATVRGRY